MPDPAKLLELAARCEAVLGADVDLNEAILGALGWTQERGTAFTPQGDRAMVIPDYTASLDAAMSLLPEKAKVVEFHQDGTHDYMWWCWIAHDLEDAQALCRTAALALTAASLRALAAKEG